MEKLWIDYLNYRLMVICKDNVPLIMEYYDLYQNIENYQSDDQFIRGIFPCDIASIDKEILALNLDIMVFAGFVRNYKLDFLLSEAEGT